MAQAIPPIHANRVTYPNGQMRYQWPKREPYLPNMRQAIDENFRWVIGGILAFIVLLVGFQATVDSRQDAMIRVVTEANSQTARTLQEVSTVVRMIDERGTAHEARQKENGR